MHDLSPFNGGNLTYGFQLDNAFTVAAEEIGTITCRQGLTIVENADLAFPHERNVAFVEFNLQCIAVR